MLNTAWSCGLATPGCLGHGALRGAGRRGGCEQQQPVQVPPGVLLRLPVERQRRVCEPEAATPLARRGQCAFGMVVK